MTENIPFAGKQVTAKLREAAQAVAKHTGKRCPNPLNTLSDRRLVEIYFRMERGQDINKIRRIIQGEWRELRNVEAKSLRRYLTMFYDAAMSPIKDILAKTSKDRQLQQKIEEKAEAILKELDGVGTLRWVIKEQVERFRAWRKLEKKSGTPLQGTNIVIRDLGDLVDKYIRVEMELGLIEKKESQADKEMRERFFDLIENNLQNSGKNLLEATSKFLEEIDDDVMTLEVGEDGEYAEVVIDDE